MVRVSTKSSSEEVGTKRKGIRYVSLQINDQDKSQG